MGDVTRMYEAILHILKRELGHEPDDDDLMAFSVGLKAFSDIKRGASPVDTIMGLLNVLATMEEDEEDE